MTFIYKDNRVEILTASILKIGTKINSEIILIIEQMTVVMNVSFVKQKAFNAVIIGVSI